MTQRGFPASELRARSTKAMMTDAGVTTGTGRMMVHEENTVDRDGAPERVSPFSGTELVVI